MDNVVTTLFMLTSVDGKISTGSTPMCDFDRDLPMVKGNVSDGLAQYYEAEKNTDKWYFISGKVIEKIGVEAATKVVDVGRVILDNYNLHVRQISYICSHSDSVIFVTTNKYHICRELSCSKDKTIYMEHLDIKEMLRILHDDFGVQCMTIQSGGELNAQFLRAKAIDFVNIVVAPILVGGKETPTLIDGESLQTNTDLNKLGVLQLVDIIKLSNSYIQLIYKVVG